MKNWLTVALALLLNACLGAPDGVAPVKGFELNRYLGTWYEIARLDHSFERGLERVTANYTMRDDGGVRVLNRGFSVSDQAWEEAVGKAYFVEDDNTGYLKVSFFGPFYGSYVIFELEQDNYDYAFISGPDTSYLWLLARTPEVAPEVIEQFERQAGRLGFDVDSLIYVEHAD
ncbi:lipocalin family protein [Pseudohongiella spirulinae]|uniref:Outer membrane lipoprotein Blc n=1 Tax=Pseudohongiella spirulinae TaxID=1249552 RepID=A0A0S2K9F0_9GAMM|nr:lipocalin family protein [Pseudohongiella spirulinae]ALO44967.1 Lipocalin family protein [Pseudohongiella spirulinae]